MSAPNAQKRLVIRGPGRGPGSGVRANLALGSRGPGHFGAEVPGSGSPWGGLDKAQWRQCMSDPRIVMIFGWCSCADNRRFAGAGGGSFPVNSVVEYHHPRGGWVSAKVLARSGDGTKGSTYSLDIIPRQRGPKPRLIYDELNMRPPRRHG